MVTLPHPRAALGKDGAALRAPGDFDRAQITKITMDTFDKPVHIDGAANRRSTRGVSLLKMVVYREKHAPDANGQRAIHYH
eukprot:10146148-Karenia_brevis.AAC.1